MIKTFQDLIVWQKAHQFTLEIYAITKFFPKEEMFGLISQLRRAIISVESNITEGFCRRSAKESKQFYYMSNSSLEEVKCQLIISRDLKYISEKEFERMFNLSEEVGKLLHSWIKSQN